MITPRLLPILNGSHWVSILMWWQLAMTMVIQAEWPPSVDACAITIAIHADSDFLLWAGMGNTLVIGVKSAKMFENTLINI